MSVLHEMNKRSDLYGRPVVVSPSGTHSVCVCTVYQNTKLFMLFAMPSTRASKNVKGIPTKTISKKKQTKNKKMNTIMRQKKTLHCLTNNIQKHVSNGFVQCTENRVHVSLA